MLSAVYSLALKRYNANVLTIDLSGFRSTSSYAVRYGFFGWTLNADRLLSSPDTVDGGKRAAMATRANFNSAQLLRYKEMEETR